MQTTLECSVLHLHADCPGVSSLKHEGVRQRLARHTPDAANASMHIMQACIQCIVDSTVLRNPSLGHRWVSFTRDVVII